MVWWVLSVAKLIVVGPALLLLPDALGGEGVKRDLLEAAPVPLPEPVEESLGGGVKGGQDGDGSGAVCGPSFFRLHMAELSSRMEDLGAGVSRALEGTPLAPLPASIHSLQRHLALTLGSVSDENGRESFGSHVSAYMEKLDAVKHVSESIVHGPGWEEVAVSQNGVHVWKKWLPSEKYGSEYPCVKATLSGVRASTEELLDLMLDSGRIGEYNAYSVGRTDIEHLGSDTKIVWNRTKPPLTKKLHDFCNIMHVIRQEDGAITLLTAAAEHPRAPEEKDSIRSEIVMGLTFIEPESQNDNCSTRVTTVNHIISNGVPTWVARKLLTQNAIDFLTNVGDAAVKSSRLCQGN